MKTKFKKIFVAILTLFMIVQHFPYAFAEGNQKQIVSITPLEESVLTIEVGEEALLPKELEVEIQSFDEEENEILEKVVLEITWEGEYDNNVVGTYNLKAKFVDETYTYEDMPSLTINVIEKEEVTNEINEEENNLLNENNLEENLEENTNEENNQEETNNEENNQEETNNEEENSDDLNNQEEVKEEVTNEINEEVDKEEKKDNLAKPKLMNNLRNGNNDDQTSSQPLFNIYWKSEANGNPIEYDTSGHVIKMEQTPVQDASYNEDKPYITAILEFNTGILGQRIEKDEVQIILPRAMFTQWDWDGDGIAEKDVQQLKVGVGLKPSETGKLFYYYYAKKDGDNYVEDPTGDYLILSNYDYLAEGHNTPNTFTCEISYPYQPSRINGNLEHELKAEYRINTDGVTFNKGNESISATIKNGAVISSVYKRRKYRQVASTTITYFTEKWNDAWGDFNDTGLDPNVEYIYVPTEIEVSVKGEYGDLPTRPFYLYITEENPGFERDMAGQYVNGYNQGKVVALKGWQTNSQAETMALDSQYSNYMTFKKLDESMTTNFGTEETWKTYEINDKGYPLGNSVGMNGIYGYEKVPNNYAKESYYTSYDSSYKVYTTVLVAYPKDYYDDLVQNQDTNYPDGYITNQVKVSLQEYGENDIQEKSGSMYFRDQMVQFRYADGPFGVTKYESTRGNSYFSLTPNTSTRYAHWSQPTEEQIKTNEGRNLIRGEDKEDQPTDMTKNATLLTGGKDAIKNNLSVEMMPFYLGDPNSTSYYWNLTLLNPDYNPDGSSEVVEPSDYGKNYYSLELMDDQIYLDGELLLPGDYEIVKTLYVATDEVVYDASDYALKSLDLYNQQHSSDSGFEKLEEIKPDVYVRYAHDEDWTLIAAGLEKGANNAINIPQKNGVGAYELKYVFKTNRVAVRPDVYLIAKLNPTDHVKEIINRNDGDVQIINVGSFGLRDANGKQWNLWDETTINGTGRIANSVKQRDQSGKYGDLVDGNPTNLPPNTYLSHERVYQYLSGFDTQTEFSKTTNTSKDDPLNLISYRTYTLKSTQRLSMITEDKDLTLKSLDDAQVEYGQRKITFYDLLPQGGYLDTTNLRAQYINDNYNRIDGEINYRTITNYKNSGRTMLIVDVNIPESDKDHCVIYDENTNELDLYSQVLLYVPMIYPWDELAAAIKADENNQRSVTNYASVYVPGSNDGYPDNPKPDGATWPNTGFKPDDINEIFKHLHGDVDSDADDSYYNSDTSTFNIATASITGYSKYVKAESEATFRVNSAVEANESYAYRLRYAAERGVFAKNIVIYDVLEYAHISPAYLTGSHKEKYDRTSRYWNGTFDRVDVTQLKQMGVDVKVYYSQTDKTVMQEGLDTFSGTGASVSEYADLSNTTYWTLIDVDALEALPRSEKEKITAIAFDCRKAIDGSDFIVEAQDDDPTILQALIYMNAPDEEEVANGWDNKGSYVDPEYVFAFNNSYLAAQTSTSGDDGDWSSNGARMSDGTTVRIAEPHPEIFKKETDSDQSAGATNSLDLTDEDTIQLKDRNEIVNYTITTKVPTLGVDAGGNDEKNFFHIYDALSYDLEFARQNDLKITIGSLDRDESYFGFGPDSEYNGHRGYLKSWTGEYEDGKKVYTETYFDSIEEFPEGFFFRYNIEDIPDYNDSFSFSNSYPPNALVFIMGYERVWNDEARQYDIIPDGYDRVREFEGEKIVIDFYAKVRDGATVGLTMDGKIPNQAEYYMPNHPYQYSNKVYLEVPEENPEPEKKVTLIDVDGNVSEEADHKTMDSLDQTIQYVIHGTIPYNAKTFRLSDTVEDVLEIDEESIRVELVGDVIVNDFDIETVQVFDSDGNPLYDYDALPYDEVEYDDDGNPTNLPYLYKDVEVPKYNDDGSLKTKLHHIDRTFNLEDMFYFTRGKYGFSLTSDKRSLSLSFDERFINEHGDAYLDGELIKRTSTGTSEDYYWYDVIYGEFGRRSLNAIRDYALAGLNVNIYFNAKIKEDADLEPYRVEGEVLIPNTVKYKIGNNPEKESEPVTVTPPDVTKTVNNKQHVDIAWDEIFTYKITTTVPRAEEGQEITSVIFSDTLEDVLEFTNNEETIFKIDGEEIDNSKVIRDGQVLSVDLTEFVESNPGAVVAITFKAKLKDGLTNDDLNDYVVKTSEARVPNEAIVKIKIDNEPLKELKSKPVTVTPPPLEKRVNQKNHELLHKKDEVFEYEINTWIPVTDKKDEKVTSFKIIDTLEDVLEFEGEYSALIDDKEVDVEAKIDGQTITFNFTSTQIEDNPKKKVEVRFKARIKDGVDLSKYLVEEDILVPNKARYQINNDNEVESNVVTITPPPIEKSVNTVKDYRLKSSDEVFEYEIKAVIKSLEEVLTKVELSDELEDVLEFVDEDKAILKLGEEELSLDYVTFESQKVSVIIEDKELLNNNIGKELVLSFKAKIKEDADLSKYKVDTIKVPNEAELIFNDNQELLFTSETVTVTPPPIIEKRVNDKFHEDLKEKAEVFTYTIEVLIPSEANAFKVYDTLEDVLEFVEVENIEILIDEVKQDITPSIDNQTISVEVPSDILEANLGKQMLINFKAKIKDGADLSSYLVDDVVLVPNTAKYMIDNNPETEKESNTVTITPPEITKKVNNKEHEILGQPDEIFNYTIETKIPLVADAFKIYDTLEDALEFANIGEEKVLIDSKEVDIKANIDKQTITFDIPEAILKENLGKGIVVSFDARIKKGADLSSYLIDNIVLVPNKAKYMIDNNPETEKESNTVTITPPELEKTVNEVSHTHLNVLEEKFDFKIRMVVPIDIDELEIIDTLEPVLELNGDVKVTSNDKDVDCEISINGQEIRVKISGDALKEIEGKTLVTEFVTTIKEGADLSPYIVEGHIDVPNTAKLIIDGQRELLSNTVKVTPPELKKYVNMKHEEVLKERNEVFTYTLSTSIPMNAEAMEFRDTLEDVLEFIDKEAIVRISGEVVKSNTTIDGQTITIKVDKEALANKGQQEIVVEFKAKIKDGANLDKYKVDDIYKVPNVGELIINNNYDLIIKSNVVFVIPPSPSTPPTPPTPPTPIPPKPQRPTPNTSTK